MDGLSGFDALRLWQERLALQTLLVYNAQDILNLNLEPLLKLAVRELSAGLLGRLG